MKTQLDILFETIREGAILIDEQGVIYRVNRAAQTIINRDKEELVGHSVDETEWPNVDINGKKTPLKSMIGLQNRGNEVKDMIVGIEHSNNELHWIRVNSNHILNRLGKFEGAIIILEDVTDQNGDDTKVKQVKGVEDLKQETRKIAHDFNNQFTCISGYAEILSEELASNKRLHRYINKIVVSIKRACSLSTRLSEAGEKV